MMSIMEKLKKAGLIFFFLVLNLVAGGIIYYLWQPIASWYFNYRPILGIDFYNFASYVSYLARHFVWQFNGWKYTWWGGGPLANDYPTLHAYLVLPLLQWFSLHQAIMVYVLSSGFLYLFFAYLLFAQISKDRVLAVVLTLASAFSIGFYGALVMGGSLPYFATQFFLPLVLWFLIKYFNTANKRWFYLSSLFLGISFLGHPQVGFSYLVPITFLLLLAYPIKGKKFFSLPRLKRILSYFIVAFLIGYPQLGQYLGRSPRQILSVLPNQLSYLINLFVGFKSTPLPTAGGDPSITAQTAPELAAFSRTQFHRLITDTNKTFFYLLVAAGIILLLSVLIRRKRKESLMAIIFALPALWVFFYISLFAFGISLFHGGWYRVFWPTPLTLGVLISFVWGDFWQAIKEKMGRLGAKPAFGLVMSFISGIIVFLAGAFLLQRYSAGQMLFEHETPGYRHYSSAFPDSLSFYTEKEEIERLKAEVVPAWLKANDRQYRLFEPDQRVNIWWNALYDLPLVKGYVELPPGDAFTGVFYWTSIALTSSGQGAGALVDSWGYPEQMAFNNALFLIDWLSIKYIEAGHRGTDALNPLTSFLAKSEIFVNQEEVVVPGWAQIYSKAPHHHRIIWHPEDEKKMIFYEIKDELTSPIVHSTNASVIGFIGKPAAYHTFLRDLAALNLNSRQVIPVRLGELIDNVSFGALEEMDAVVLYSYDYRNYGQAWGKLEKYIEGGGKALIETGSKVKETDSVNLPASYSQELPSIFPIKMTNQAEIGSQWQLSGKTKETEKINLKDFGPPLIDNQPWLFSLPNTSQGLRQGARTILSADGIPLIVAWQYGKGEVIWSGMNLPFHLMTHKNIQEAELLKNLLENFVAIDPIDYSSDEVERISPNKLMVKGTKAKGVIFRENFNPGWQASLKANGKSQKLRIYPAGPTFYGFAYAPLPEGTGGSFTVTFSYRGEPWVYFWTIVSFLTIIILLDKIIINSRLIAPFLNKIASPFRKRISGWWEKEEEY